MDEKKQNAIGDVFKFAKDKKKIFFSVFFAIVSVFSGLVPYIAAARLLVALIQGSITVNMIIVWGLSAVAGYLLKTVGLTVSTALSHSMAFSVIAEIRTMLSEKMLRISLGKVKEKTAGEYKQIIMDEIDHLEYPLAHMIPELTSNLLGFIAVLIYIFLESWQLGLAAIGTLVAGFIIYGLMMAGNDVMGIFKQYTADSETMSGVMVEYVRGMEVIKAFGRTASSMEKFSSSVMNFKNSMKKWFAHCYPFLAGFYVVTPNSLLFVLPIGAILMLNGFITLEAFIICSFLAFGVAEPLIKIIEFSDNIMAIQTSMTKVNEILDTEEMNEGSLELNGTDLVEASGITFGYSEKQIIKGISFEVKKGDKIAFVGASGSGKSTIAKLLARFYDVEEGSIKINGQDIRNVPVNELMNSINYVTQDNYLMDISIMDNIRFGNQSASDEQVIDIAKKTGCHEFIMELPDRYNTTVGSAGAKLSGGQKQRIAIARAMLKNSPIVILDEATAFMDPENENLVQQSINALTKDKTLIIIAHRLQTVVDCNRIYVVSNGRITDSGTHNELLESCEYYRSMWKHNFGEEV